MTSAARTVRCGLALSAVTLVGLAGCATSADPGDDLRSLPPTQAAGSDDVAPEETTAATSETTSDPMGATTALSTDTTDDATTGEDDMRPRVADGLRELSGPKADLVAMEDTTLTPVDTDVVPGWTVIDVQNLAPPNPQRFFVGLADDGTVAYLTGDPDAFDRMVAAAGTTVDDAETATALANLRLDATREFTVFSTRVESVDDIDWRPELDDAQAAERERIEQEFGDVVAPAEATAEGDGWAVVSWTVTGQDLVRHDVTVGADGTVQDDPEVVATDLPVPVSL